MTKLRDAESLPRTIPNVAPSPAPKTQSLTNSEVVARDIANLHLGAQLKRLRFRKKLSLADLGKHTGLSASMLSQLENGKMIPTLQSLARIATVLDVGLDFFFASLNRLPLTIVRVEDRVRLSERPELDFPSYWFEHLTTGHKVNGFEVYVADFPFSNTFGTSHSHQGSEFLYVLNGALSIRYLNIEYLLNAHDTLVMDSSELHAYKGSDGTATKAIVVIVSPQD